MLFALLLLWSICYWCQDSDSKVASQRLVNQKTQTYSVDYENGNTYFGWFVEWKPHGKGVLRLWDTMKLQWVFQKGKLSGHWRMKTPSYQIIWDFLQTWKVINATSERSDTSFYWYYWWKFYSGTISQDTWLPIENNQSSMEWSQNWEDYSYVWTFVAWYPQWDWVLTIHQYDDNKNIVKKTTIDGQFKNWNPVWKVKVSVIKQDPVASCITTTVSEQVLWANFSNEEPLYYKQISESDTCSEKWLNTILWE